MLRLIYISRLDAALNRSGLQGVQYSYTPAALVQAARAPIENTLSQHILIKVSLHIKPSHYLQFAVESFFSFFSLDSLQRRRKTAAPGSDAAGVDRMTASNI